MRKSFAGMLTALIVVVNLLPLTPLTAGGSLAPATLPPSPTPEPGLDPEVTARLRQRIADASASV